MPRRRTSQGEPDEVHVSFERGLETVRSPFARKGLEAMDNVRLSPDDYGAIESMPGYSKVNSAGFNAGAATFHTIRSVVKSNGTRKNLVGWKDGTKIRISDIQNGGTETDIITEATANIARTVPDFSVATLADTVLIANGTDTVAKYDFTTASKAGLTVPTVTSVTATPKGETGKNVFGIVKYYLATISGTAESALSAPIPGATGVNAGANGDRVDLDLNNMAAGTYRVYRTIRERAEARFLTESVHGGTLTDNTLDAALGELPFLHGNVPPPGMVSLLVHQGRAWGLRKDGWLYWCELQRDGPAVESWWTEDGGNKVQVNRDDGDFGVALVSDGNTILVFKENHIYRILGTEFPDNISIQSVTAASQESKSVGLPSEYALATTPGGFAFYHNRTVYAYQGGQLQAISQDIEDDLFAIRSQDEADGVYLGYFPKRRHLYVSVPLSAGVTPTHTYVYDMDQGQWLGRYTKGFRGFAATEVSDEEEFWGLDSSGGGFVFQFEDGTSYGGSAIAASLELSPFYGGNPSAVKNFLYVDLHYKPVSSGTVDVVLEVDGKTSATKTVSGVSMVAANTARAKKRINWGTLGRELKVKVNSSSDTAPQWKLLGLTYGFQIEGSVSV